jgi:hypothetical protein
MFTIERHELIANIEKLRKNLCCYATHDRCDCKYGVAEKKMFENKITEQTGCPELRCVLLVLSNMTDEEYSKCLEGNVSIKKLSEALGASEVEKGGE